MSFCYSPEALRQFDQMIANGGVHTLAELMSAAGKGVAAAAQATAQRISSTGRKVSFAVIAGKGNNGGDAIVAAQQLFRAGYEVKLMLPFGPEAFSELPASFYSRLPKEIPVITALPPRTAHNVPVIIDGLLGTGFHGTLSPALAQLIEDINQSHCPVISIDCPSGLDCATGAGEPCVHADLTVTLAAPKSAMLTTARGIESTGRLIVSALPGQELLTHFTPAAECFGEEDALKLIPESAFAAHKYTRGCVYVVGGSEQYPGAPSLAGTAALCAGAGMVHVLTPPAARVSACFNSPAALIYGTSEERPTRCDALVIGPGMGKSASAAALLRDFLALPFPKVLDADALNLIAESPELLEVAKAAAKPVILTPHAGEFSRLAAAFGITPSGDRQEDAQSLAAATGAVVVLKGARTVVAEPAGRVTINLSGCPALATAGAGDVLSGVIGALLARGLSAGAAARLGVWVHGAAAEARAGYRGQFGVIADDLPRAIAEILSTL